MNFIYKISNLIETIFKKRTYRLLYQKITRGWDDSDTWSLTHTVANYTLPRLKKFRELTIAHPHEFTYEEWLSIIDEMIWSLDIIARDGKGEFISFKSRKESRKFYRGLRLFGKHLNDLWW